MLRWKALERIPFEEYTKLIKGIDVVADPMADRL